MAPASSSHDAGPSASSASKAGSNSPMPPPDRNQSPASARITPGGSIAAAAAAASIAASSAKKKGSVADAVVDAVGAKKDRKRKRMHYSCAECHRRKHKCDAKEGNWPCTACKERGLADDCRPFSDGDENGDVRDRLKRMEDLVEGLAVAHTALAKEFVAFRAQQGGTPSNGSASNMSMEALKRMGGHGISSSILNLANAVTAAAGDAMDDTLSDDEREKRKKPRAWSHRGIEREELRAASRKQDDDRTSGQFVGVGQEEDVASGNPLFGSLTREGESYFGGTALPSVSRGVIETRIHGERLELNTSFPLRSASAKIHRLIQEGGAPTNVVDELMSRLPPKDEADYLLDIYFRDINDTRLPIDENTFRASYEELCEWRYGNAREEEGDDGARHIPFLSFLYVILAIAKRNEPEERSTDEEAKKGSLTLFHTARRAMAIASAIRADHIDVLLAAMFGCRFLICLRMSAESWSLLGTAIRAAQAIGLHRDGTKLGLDSKTTERRRRLWALLYYLDATTSMLLGRPRGINDAHCDVLKPSDVDLDMLPRFGPAPVPEPYPPSSLSPHGPPGVYTFISIRHELAKLAGRVVEHFQDLSRPRSYSDVLALDADLEHFIHVLPAPYRCDYLGGVDRSFDKANPLIKLHRYLVSVEYHYVRITLHRPYLLRAPEKYSASRTAAFASARADRHIRQQYKREVEWPKDRARSAHMGGLYRLFSSVLICGLQLLLEPGTSEAPELHAALDNFLALKSNQPADTSQCTRREIEIIKLFKDKTSGGGTGGGGGGAANGHAARQGGGGAAQGTSAGIEASKVGAAVGLAARLPAGPHGGPLAPLAESPEDRGSRAASPSEQKPTLTSAPNGASNGGSAGAAMGGQDGGANSTSTSNANVDSAIGQSYGGSVTAEDAAQDLFDQLGGLDFGLPSASGWDVASSGNGNLLDSLWMSNNSGAIGAINVPASAGPNSPWGTTHHQNGLSLGPGSGSGSVSQHGMQHRQDGHAHGMPGSNLTPGAAGGGPGSHGNGGSGDWGNALTPWGGLIDAIVGNVGGAGAGGGQNGANGSTEQQQQQRGAQDGHTPGSAHSHGPPPSR